MSHSYLPPHLNTISEVNPEEELTRKPNPSPYGRQGRSKYGKGGARKHKSLGKSKK